MAVPWPSLCGGVRVGCREAAVITQPSPGSTSGPVPERLELQPDLAAPALARQFVAERMNDYPGEVIEDALILTSEVVTNAIRHGAGRVALLLALDAALVQVDVHDDGPGGPPIEANRPPDEVPGGRGLIIVEAIATDWGVVPDPEGQGKTVWFELLSTRG